MSNEDTLRSLGKIIDGSAQRDAVHIAVAPVVADEVLQPGQGIAFVANNSDRVRRFWTTIGIVDPFLTDSVQPGQRFFMFLHPGSITSLRHDWTHPAFSQEGRIHIPAGVSQEERRLREIAAAIGIGYEEMMSGADEWVETSIGSKWGGEYLVQHGSENWRDDFRAYVDEFWRLYEVVRGKTVPTEHKESFFSCSC